MNELDIIKKRNWSSKKIFCDIRNDNHKVHPDYAIKYRDFFYDDLRAEFDSLNLYLYIMNNKRSYSGLFLHFIDVWYQDERNHAHGFLAMIKLLYDDDVDKILKDLHSRVPLFSPYEEIFLDEFKLLLLFAYDEFVTVKTYRKDIFYYEFGHVGYVDWIKNLIADEGFHFGNAIRLIKFLYPQRLSESSEVLNGIISFEGITYQNTFIFDHDGSHFLLDANETGQSCLDDILRIINA